METKNTIEFLYNEQCKKLRSVDSTYSLFCLYVPKRIDISGCDEKRIDLETKVILPSNMSARIWFLPSLEKEKLYIEYNDIINSGRWLKILLLNQNFMRKITIWKGDRLIRIFVYIKY